MAVVTDCAKVLAKMPVGETLWFGTTGSVLRMERSFWVCRGGAHQKARSIPASKPLDAAKAILGRDN